MLEYVDYIKVKVTGEEEDRERRSLENVVEMAHGFGKEVIAISINTKEAFLLAKEIHTDYVEGAYISDTSVSKSREMEYLQGNLYQLIMEVTKDEPDMEVMEQIVTRDAALTYALLKMANSAYFSAKHRTASVRQAIMRVGINQLKPVGISVKFSGGRIRNGRTDENVIYAGEFCSGIGEEDGTFSDRSGRRVSDGNVFRHWNV